ncbi:lipopolysaccharide transport periplasmic protein LptA [Hippea jasoniae]|uniref:lipopolysaccharide transport periplasmic protein LptA n=1 Tax=Hippea jasoniae TaxID=944479 RepID=UPI00054E5F0C|nr:lipopolysaccharide transport periplasmic protein LptA [Hippea jasoniae]
MRRFIKNSKILIFELIFLIASGLNSQAFNVKQYAKTNRLPVHITANKLEAFDKKGLYIFSGNVVVVRGDTTLKADKMKVYKNLKNGDISKIVCIGHVVITKQDKKAVANRATYFAAEDKVVLEGNAHVYSNKNSISSDLIVYYLDKDYAVSQSDNNSKRVEVIIYPSKKEKK